MDVQLHVCHRAGEIAIKHVHKPALVYVKVAVEAALLLVILVVKAIVIARAKVLVIGPALVVVLVAVVIN